MEIKELSISSQREGILTMKGDILTVISDQKIVASDILHSKAYKDANSQYIPFIVDEIIEERPSRGDWNDAPPIWRKIKFHKG